MPESSDDYTIPKDVHQAQMCIRIVPGVDKPSSMECSEGECSSCGVGVWVQVNDGKPRRGIDPNGVIHETIMPYVDVSPLCGPCSFKITTAMGDHVQAARIKEIVERAEGIIV